MKYCFGFIMIVSAILSCCVVLGTGRAGERAGPDGVYEGSGQGYRGKIHVLVRIEGGRIAEIEVVYSMEDRAVGGEAMEELANLVLEYNSTDIDAISGATESSKGFLEAVLDAILTYERMPIL